MAKVTAGMITVALMLILSGCIAKQVAIDEDRNQDHPSVMAEKTAQENDWAAAKEVKTANQEEPPKDTPKTDSPIKPPKKEEPPGVQKVDDNIYVRMNAYLHAWVSAINTNSFHEVAPYLQPNSSLYYEQKALINNLFQKRITKELVDFKVMAIYEDDTTAKPDDYKIQTAETMKVYQADGSASTTNDSWLYSAEYSNGALLLTKIERVKE
ncbi:hypothetical protein FZC66_18620 [Priestia megaterium]|nr:hypothetical protein FZC66_18620 [Priestia megaterium]